MRTVKSPNLRIVGEQARFDQRLTVFNRAARGELGEKVRQRSRSDYPDALGRALAGRDRPDNSLIHHLIPAVDGPVNPQRAPVDPTHISWKVKQLARFFGADLVGICELEPAYIYSHHGLRCHVDMGVYGQPVELAHRYAIVIAREMDLGRVRASPSYILHAEIHLTYAEVARTACQLAAYIRELGYPARAHHLRNEDVLHVPLAVKAGLGELGRLGLLITREFGPRVRLATVTTDLPLVPDRPVDLGVQAFCQMCRKCAVNCPPKTIPAGEPALVRGVEKWAIDPDRCYTYWRANPEKWPDCSDCIKTCPWSRPNVWYHRAATWLAARSRLSHYPLLWLDDLLHGRRPNYKVRWLDYSKDW